ncbi:MAG: homocysteine S-methyltransferase family protein [Candidatus Neomarinimicrobiota bacterium]
MNRLIRRLEAGEILVGDGAMGTMLFEQGLKTGDCPEKMNQTHPDVLQAIARAYAEAGADIVSTNSFGGSPVKLAEYDLADRTEELNGLAVKLVREAVGSEIIVSGSCGPTGKLLLPYGDAEPGELLAGFKRQIGALVAAGADVICIETMIDLQEALLALRAAREVAPQVPVMATMTFDKTPNGYFTIMGTAVAVAARELAAAGATVVGSNCGNGLDRMIEITGEFKSATDLPIMIQSNAGLPECISGRLVYPESPDYFAERIGRLIEAGAAIIGGCCGTTPAHIRAVRNAIDKK